LIQRRRGGAGNDYVSILLRGQAARGISDEDLISQMIMMFVAGQVTTTDQINNIMYLLAQDPSLQIALRKNPELLENALEEMKRFDPAVTFIFRVCRQDTDLNGHIIKKGEVVFISNHCVNRDLPDIEYPNEINFNRDFSHFAYGHGQHYCLGAKLGRLEIRLLFEEIFKQLPVLILNSKLESKRDHYSLSFSGFENLFLKIQEA
jgi:cytochrome P450